MRSIPSIDSLVSGALNTFIRFPFTLIAAILGTLAVLGMINIDYPYDREEMNKLLNVGLVSSIGLTVFTALTIYSERMEHKLPARYGIQIVAALLLVFYFISLPVEYTRYDILRYMIYGFSGHLLVSFLPYAGKKEPQGFWSYNERLFVHFLTSALYSAVLIGGLSIALLAIDNLFDVDIEGESYVRLNIIIIGIFNTWFFLSGVPRDFYLLETGREYPKALKIFTQYVLIPLITVYMIILYAYMFKIIFTGQWPEGWVSWLVLCFSVAGILALLLIWPIREREENKWMKYYAKGFYFALFPLVILLFFSIRIRINAYGITEGRYYVLLLAAWLACIAAYFLFSKTKSIKVIPVSLFVIGILSVHGPWSSFAVSRNSQLSRMEGFLEKNEMISEGKIIPAKGKIPREDESEIGEKVDYLIEVHGQNTLQEYFSQDLDSLVKPDSNNAYVDKTGKILSLMNLERVYGYAAEYTEEYINFSVAENEVLNVSGFDYVFETEFYSLPGKDTLIKEILLDSLPVSIYYKPAQKIIALKAFGETISFSFDTLLTPLINRYKNNKQQYNITPELMTFQETSGHLTVRLSCKTINLIQEKDKQIRINGLDIRFFVKKEY